MTKGSAARPCSDEEVPGARRHDGFFARSETGVVYLGARVGDGGPSPRRSAVRGFGQSAAISVGGTPRAGLVVGGTMWTTRIDPVFVEGGQTVSPDDDSVKITLLRTGPFVDWYPDPEGGFHAQSAVAVILEVETDVRGNAVKPAGVGAAMSLGGGYEWFVARELSVGFILRTTLSAITRTPAIGDQRMLGVLPELALSVTYH